MTIAEMRERSNQALQGVPKDLLVVAIVFLAASASFGLGILAGKGMAPTSAQSGFWVEELATSTRAGLPAAAVAAEPALAPTLPVVSAGTSVAPEAGKYLASKSGTKYYLPTCSGAKRIKPENIVWFASLDDAKASGRTAASNCPGL